MILCYNTFKAFSKLTKDKNLYSTKAVMLPTPIFISFYNGTDDIPDRTELKLSDCYIIPAKYPALELTSIMFNNNKGHNKELLDACKTLHDYAEYTARVRAYSADFPLEDAVELAITECIKEGIQILVNFC